MISTRVREASKLSPVRDVQDEVKHLERLNDDMLASGGALLASVMEANRLAGAKPELGQPAIRATLDWLNAMVAARERGIGAHAEFRTAVGQVNLREMGWGDLTDCPSVATSDESDIAPRAPLHIVASS